jgi:SprT protein
MQIENGITKYKQSGSTMSLDDMVKPINDRQQQKVIATTRHYIARAAEIMQCKLTTIAVEFDLKGLAAGMYCVRAGQRWIRYNPYIFAKYFDDNLAQTVPHEVAHYAIECVYGHRNVRPHGKEWRGLMQAMGIANAARTCEYDLMGIPRRRQNYHSYACACSSYQLTRRRHNKINRHGARYYCRQCQQLLTLKL